MEDLILNYYILEKKNLVLNYYYKKIHLILNEYQ